MSEFRELFGNPTLNLKMASGLLNCSKNTMADLIRCKTLKGWESRTKSLLIKRNNIDKFINGK